MDEKNQVPLRMANMFVFKSPSQSLPPWLLYTHSSLVTSSSFYKEERAREAVIKLWLSTIQPLPESIAQGPYHKDFAQPLCASYTTRLTYFPNHCY
jgi:hypothetical protein